MSTVKMKMEDKFYSTEVDADEFKKIVEEFVLDAHPGDEIDSFNIDDDGKVIVKLKSKKEVEIDIDWNEFVLK